MNFISNTNRWMASGYFMRLSSGFGQTFFIALFADQIRSLLDISYSEWGGIYMIATITSAIMLSQFGKLADYYHPKYLSIIILSGLSIAALGMYFSHHILTIVITIWGLRFFGQGGISHLSSTTMAKWFTSNRGKALAITGLGMATGEAIFPVLVTYSLTVWEFGWKNIWLVVAIVITVFFQPVIYGLLKNNSSKAYLEHRSKKKAERKQAKKQFSAIKRSQIFIGLMFGVGLGSIVITIFFFQASPLVQEKNWSILEFTSIYFFYSIFSVVSNIWTGRMVDRIGALKCMPFYFLPLAFGCFLVYFIDSFWVGSFIFMSFGFSSGSIATSAPALWTELYGTEMIGSIKALVQAVIVLGSAIGPFVSGYLLENEIGMESQNLILMGVIGLFTVWYVSNYPKILTLKESNN